MFQEEEYQKIIHETKNSICIIGNALQLIQKQHPEVVSFRYWDSTMSELSQLNVLFSDVASARLFDTLHPTCLQSTEFLEEMKQYTASFLPKNISYSYEWEDALPYIQIDKNAMKHAIFNIIKNAVEAIEHTGQITIRAFPKDNCLNLQIQDNGCGIPSEKLDFLFTPKHSSKKNGSGLGLAIAKQIITSHNGFISCISSPSCGTTFTIQIPEFIPSTHNLDS